MKEVHKAEEKIQQEIVMRFRNTYCLKHHKPRLKIFAVPNADVSGDLHRMKMVATGLEGGVSDLIVLLPGAVALFVEVKTEVGRQSDKQKSFQQQVEDLGFVYHLVRSAEAFFAIPEISALPLPENNN